MSDLRELRRQYSDAGIDTSTVDPDPFAQFGAWFRQALDAGLSEGNGFVLSTVDEAGHPAQRTVLLKHWDEQGFVFFTNHASRKGRHLDADPRVSMLFPWYPLHRQVHIEGRAERVSRERSESYFATRPRGSRLGAWASRQSEPLSGRDELEARVAEMESRFEGEPPLPPFWGGYRVRPARFEFWQGRSDRLHDRVVYTLDNDRWRIGRLYP